MSINRNELCKIVKKLDEGGTAKVSEVIQDLKNLGAVRNQHLGNKTLTEDETVEWYAGQGLDILEESAFFAVNSWINCLEKFVPCELSSYKGYQSISL